MSIMDNDNVMDKELNKKIMESLINSSTSNGEVNDITVTEDLKDSESFNSAYFFKYVVANMEIILDKAEEKYMETTKMNEIADIYFQMLKYDKKVLDYQNVAIKDITDELVDQAKSDLDELKELFKLIISKSGE